MSSPPRAAFLFLFFVFALAITDGRSNKHGNELVPSSWTVQSELPNPEMTVKLYFAFQNMNQDWMHKMLRDVSEPFSPLYGNYPSFKEVQEMTRPSDISIQRVTSWIENAGLILSLSEQESASHTGYIPLKMTISQAEKLLECRFRLYKHKNSQKIIARSLSYSVPSSLDDVISFVGAVDHFPMEKLGHSRTAPPSSSIVNPAAIRSHYNIPDDLRGVAPTNSMSVAEFDDQWYDSEDLSLFFQRNSLPDTPVARVVGTNNDTTGEDGGEADLDIQYLMGMGVNVPTWFISFDNTIGDGFLEWIIYLLQLGDSAPLLQSTSYGADERYLSLFYLNRVSQDFMKFGMTGHTLFYSSGDFGVGCNCNLPNNVKYVAHFPASSPYVTAVGGTISLPTTNGTEIGVSFSGGGFSNYFSRLSFQDEAVETFLNTSSSLPSGNYYNSGNRGYPDLSAWALGYEIYEHGSLDYIGGTSASTPAVAGMFSLLNDLRLQQNMPSLGFLNPSLYSMLQTPLYNDITRGNNGNSPCCEGFTAQEGWDPMTGLGSPDFEQLRTFFIQNFAQK